MDETVSALAAEEAELSALLAGLGPDDWHRPTRCEGWDVADVVLHLAQTNEMAVGSATDRYGEVLDGLTDGLTPSGSVDDGVAAMVRRERGASSDQLFARWSQGCTDLVEALDADDMSRRVQWVAGQLSLRTLATTRVAETWIHAGDIAGAVGATMEPTDRLRLIARLAWRTLPYAFGSAGRQMAGPVAFRLRAPRGEAWDFLPDEPAVTTISGPALDLCGVAARRVKPSETALTGEGPDGEAVLALVRTYA
jgi:uncharacterized protein (TIGR03084 family)